jgi:MFS family permease
MTSTEEPGISEEEDLKDKSLRITVKENALGSAAGSIGDTYITPYLIAVKATLSEIAAFTSITSLVAPLAQLFTSRLIEKFGRKKIVFRLAILQALIWLPIIASVLLYLNGLKNISFLIIVLWTVYALVGNLSAPAGNSWIGDLVPEIKRGRYFAFLNSTGSIISLIGVIASSFFLDYGKQRNNLFYCFIALFGASAIFRFFALYYTKQKYEPKLTLEEGYYFSFWSFIKRMKNNNFGKFVLHRSIFALAVNIAAPFYGVFVLRELGFSYVQYTIALIIVPTVIQVILFPFWGKFSDKYGNVETLKASGLLASIYPILWIFSQNFYYILLVPMILNGIAWAGLNLATANFIFDNVTPKRRSLCFAYFSVLAGFGVFIGAGLGGFLAKMPIGFMNIFLFIFLISGILRLISILIFGRKVNEVRPVKGVKLPYHYLQLLFRPFFRRGD